MLASPDLNDTELFVGPVLGKGPSRFPEQTIAVKYMFGLSPLVNVRPGVDVGGKQSVAFLSRVEV